MGECGLDLFGLGWGPMAGSCEHCYELLGCMKGRQFLELKKKIFYRISCCNMNTFLGIISWC
jgi:hypothetical protein